MQMTPVHSIYGAPMGRAEFRDAKALPKRNMRLFRVRINSGGYDDGGAYWGIGAPLYCAEALADGDDGGDYFLEFARAYSRTISLYPAGRPGESLPLTQHNRRPARQGWNEMATNRNAQTEKAEAIARLREWLKPGDTVYTILRHVSKSGMQREIGIVIFRDGNALHPNWAVSKALGMTLATGARDAIKVRGCGMDMGFHVVYNLAYCLFDGDGYALKQQWL